MEKLIKQWICKHLETNKAIIRSQYRFVTNTSFQINFIAFFDKVAKIEDQRSAMDILYFSKVFDKVEHSLHLGKIKKMDS